MALSPTRQRLAVVVLMLAWCFALIFYRMYLGAEWLAFGLLWNLFLAVLPLLWSSAFQNAIARGHRVLAGVFFVLWLLFLPNAPYILTDLIHLSPRPGVPLWYILALLLSCAGTGTLLGYFSLFDVHKVVEEQWGKRAGWFVVVSALMLCGFGIYIGRFLRWNSWNAFTHPIQLLQNVVNQFIHPGSLPNPISVTLVFGIGMIVGYLALYTMAFSMREE